MKIRNKIKIAFGVIIVAFIGEISLTQWISSRAEKSFNKLKEETIPILDVIDHFTLVNTELKYLLYAKINTSKFQYNNRIKAIIDVEIPVLQSDISIFSESKNPGLETAKKIRTLRNQSDSLIGASKDILNLLIVSSTYNQGNIIKKAQNKYHNIVEPSADKIALNLAEFQMFFAQELSTSRENLTYQLQETSKIIFITGLLGILIVLFISEQTIRALTQPIVKLIQATKKVSSGNYKVRANINTKDEFFELGKNFDMMTASLDQNFQEIQDKNQELQQFTYVTSHDLQEPLTTISAMANLVKSSYSDLGDDTFKKTIDYMDQSAQHMGQLISGLLQYSQIGTKGKKERIHLNTLITEILQELVPDLNRKDGRVAFPELPNVYGFRKEIKELFIHLIMNALEFSREDVPPEIQIICRNQGSNWEIGVQDNGAGIAKQHQERIFMIFQRLQSREVKYSIGLGLAYCKKIAQLHKGDIRVESNLNAGSTFYFTLSK
ncbi:MAG: signal transduction histidine kinase [Sphingobacteriales bacterium]|jgi:signal transduction histidine kinase